MTCIQGEDRINPTSRALKLLLLYVPQDLASVRWCARAVSVFLVGIHVGTLPGLLQLRQLVMNAAANLDRSSRVSFAVCSRCLQLHRDGVYIEQPVSTNAPVVVQVFYS